MDGPLASRLARMSRRISSLRPKKLSSAAPRRPSRPRVLSLATDHQLVRMKPICLLARCSWSPACCHTRHCSGVSVLRNRKRVKMPWRALCTRVMSWRARTSMSEAFLMAPSICAAMPLRRWRSAATSGSSGGSLAAGGAPSLAICERTSSSGLRSLSAACLGVVLDLLDAGAQRGEIALASRAIARGSSRRPRWRSAGR